MRSSTVSLSVSLSTVNHALTIHPAGQPSGNSRPARPRRRDVVENDEYAAFTRRIIRAYTRRVATGDVGALTEMVGLSTLLDEAIAQAVIEHAATFSHMGHHGPQHPASGIAA
jgi:hypothetical protein